MLGRRDNGAVGREACAVADFWLPTAAGSVRASWFWPRQPLGPDAVGVLLVPSIIHEEQTIAVGLVALANELADRGMPALLVDLAGTAQGALTLDTPDVGRQWADDVRSAVHHMRDSGLGQIAVVGVRLGALIAADALAEEPVDHMTMWAPVMSGKRYVRELQLMQSAATGPTATPMPGVNVAGFNLPPDLVDHIKSLDAAKLDGKPASRLCIVDSPERIESLDLDHPLFAEVRVDRLVAPQTDPWLFTAADAFGAPFDDIAAVCTQVDRSVTRPTPGDDVDLQAARMPQVSGLRTQEFEHDGVMIRETLVSFGGSGFYGRPSLSGILSAPVDEPSHSAGSAAPSYVAVTTVGPGRIFVDFARREAALGRTTLRFDLSGFGTSARRSNDAWADYYHPTARDDIAEAVAYMVGRGHGTIHIVGFCAGAWSALQMRPRAEVASITAINPQLFVRSRLARRQQWPGMTAPQQLAARVAGNPLAHRISEKYEVSHPVPSPSLRWIRRDVASGTHVTLVFAADDYGLEYFRRRSGSPLALGGSRHQPSIRTYEGLGHLPGGPARERLLADIHEITS